jgi:hypothetical protein
MTFYKTFGGFGVVVKIHRDHIGYVCGGKCATVSEIGRATHTRVHVGEDDVDGVKDVTIGGRSTNDVRSAYERIMCVARKAEERMPRVSEMGSLNDCRIGGMIGVECRMEIAGEDVGMVLGGKGSTLRKIGKDTWTWIKLFPGSAPTFSVRGFLRSDVDEAIKRISSIAQESYNRRSGGAHHHRVPRAHEPMNLGEKVGEFNMAPVPAGKRRKSPVEVVV